MQLSARNQLKGTIKSVRVDGIMAEVAVDIGGQEMVSTITRGSAERMSLAAGQAVVVIIKASEVLIGKSD
jgi:molybdopterin-binding protein